MHIPTDKDDDAKLYLRMRDDHKLDLKKTKQRIYAFCLSHGFHYDKGKWTQAQLKWLKSLELSELDRETLNEYLITYEYQTNRIEASKGICKGAVGHKSKDLKARQSGNPLEVVAYADKANVRLRRKYYKMIRHGKKKNVAVTAVARELACFI